MISEMIISGKKTVYSLNECLKSMSMKQLSLLAELINAGSVSEYSFNKSNYVYFLSNHIRDLIQNIFMYTSRDEYFYFLQLAHLEHIKIDENEYSFFCNDKKFSNYKLSRYVELGFIYLFQTSIKNEYELVFPLDLEEALSDSIRSANNSGVESLYKITRYASSVVSYYGICSFKQFCYLWNMYKNNPKLTQKSISKHMNYISLVCEQVERIEESIISCYALFSAPNEIDNLLNRKPPFYVPKEEELDVEIGTFIEEENPYYVDFVTWMFSHFGEGEEVKDFISSIYERILLGQQSDEDLLKFLPDNKYSVEFLDLYKKFESNCHCWMLGGYSYNQHKELGLSIFNKK